MLAITLWIYSWSMVVGTICHIGVMVSQQIANLSYVFRSLSSSLGCGVRLDSSKLAGWLFSVKSCEDKKMAIV